MLQAVGLDESYRTRWPNELSGGQRQRVAIAIALILDPAFVVCDEPVSALDVSVQAQVLNLLLDLRKQFGLTYLFISHDLNVVSYMSDRIGVMYLGNLVELGDGAAISQMPLHPYTEALFSASMEVEGDRERIILSGDLPSPAHPPAGCPFHTRCFACTDRCKVEKPQLREFEGGWFCACHRVEERTGLRPVELKKEGKNGMKAVFLSDIHVDINREYPVAKEFRRLYQGTGGQAGGNRRGRERNPAGNPGHPGSN